MSATAVRERPSKSKNESALAATPRSFQILELGTIAFAFALLAGSFLSSGATLSSAIPAIAIWLPIVVIADLMPVSWRPVEFTMSLPVLLAAAMLFPPLVTFVLGFIGTIDLREFRRDISFTRGLFNRSNIALSVWSASWAFHHAGGDVRAWPSAVGFAFLALGVDTLVNNSLTLAGAHFLFQRPMSEILHDVYGRGRTLQFLLGYISFGSTAILLASVYLFAGNWALIAFIIPVILAHEMFSNGAALGLASIRLRRQQSAFASLSERIADERRDERLTVAADLHDEVLPPLFKVHLMAQVIRQDLASGRLLELDDDVPGLLEAADAANEAIRVLIRDLRRSALGVYGLRHTLMMLIRQVERDYGVSVTTDLHDVSGHPLSQLLAYQVAREAIRNAVKHAPGSPIRVSLSQDDDEFRLVVEDRGPGFTQGAVDEDKHFGLQLMRERAALCGGIIAVDSTPGHGTTVAARFPIEPSRPTSRPR